MIINTITCHDVYNYGASLQAYALAEFLRGSGHKVSIIDYKPDYLNNHYRLWGLDNPAYDKPVLREFYNAAKFPRRLKNRMSRRKKEFDSFTRSCLPLTPKKYLSCEMLADDPPKADLYIAGSDQIWNSLFKNGRDPAFYLDFAPEGAIRASYAASFSTSSVPERYVDQVAKWLSSLDHISVREDSALKILEDLGIRDAVRVLDPVFLLNKEHWSNIADTSFYKEPYLLLYDFDNNDALGKAVRDLADSHKLKVYSALPSRYADKCFDQEGPLTFTGLIKNAETVFSNSFHATAFSLIFQKDFWVIDRKEALNSRMRDLAALAGLSDRVVSDYRFDLSNKIGYEKAEPLVSKEIESSVRFIEKITRG